MPSASLPALAATRPGPRMAKKRKTALRARGLRRMRLRSVVQEWETASSAGRRVTSQSATPAPPSSPEQLGQARPPLLRQDQVDRVVDGHDPQQLVRVVDDGNGQQVVMGDRAGDPL